MKNEKRPPDLNPAVAPIDPLWLQRAAEHQRQLTMPTGALGRLLELGRQLAAVQQTLKPQAQPAAVVVLAADHGIVEEGVSAYPQSVTAQMLANFLQGGAAINVLARRAGAAVLVVNMGLRNVPPSTAAPAATLVERPVGRGTANFLHQPAMSRPQLRQALQTGREVVDEYLLPRQVKAVALGEMGIGNSTSAAALTAALTGLPAAAVTGPGTGLDDAGLRRKIDVIDRALACHFPSRKGYIAPQDALLAVGGFEIAGLVGVALQAAARRLVVVLDGFISSVAGLLAVRLEPAARAYLIAGHKSTEPGHQVVLEALGLAPLLDLGLRLGEGTGAALALPLLQGAAEIMGDMATFSSAGVSERS